MSYLSAIPVQLEWDSNFKGMNAITLKSRDLQIVIGLDDAQSDKVMGFIQKISETRK